MGKTGYQNFCDEHRKKVADELSITNKRELFKQVNKVLGERWRNLSDAEKNEYKTKGGGRGDKKKEQEKKKAEEPEE